MTTTIENTDLATALSNYDVAKAIENLETPLLPMSAEIALSPADHSGVEDALELLPKNDKGLVVISFAKIKADLRVQHPNATSAEIKKLAESRMGQFRPIQAAYYDKLVSDGCTLETRQLKNGGATFKLTPPKVSTPTLKAQLQAALDRLAEVENELAKKAAKAKK